MDLKTPGREDESDEMKLYSKSDYKEKKSGKGNANADKAAHFLEYLGGKDNIVDVTNCATRLRLTVKDPDLVASDAVFRQVGAQGLVKNGGAIQIIVGLSVPSLRDEFEKLL